MKIRSALLRLLVSASLLGSASAGLGQVITWTNVVAATLPGGNFGTGSNWSGDNGSGTATTNTPISGSVPTFDGTVPGPLYVYTVNGINGAGGGNPIGGSFGASGVSIHLTPTQISPVTFYATNASVGMGFNGITLDAGSGQFTLGDNTPGVQMICTLRPSSGIHNWENDSAFPMVINPTFQIQNGGGTSHQINFMGTGDFAITNNLRNNNNAGVNTLEWDSTGHTVWVAGGPNDKFNDGGLANVNINAGTVTIKSQGLLPITFGNSLTVNGTLVLDSGAGADTLNRAILGTGAIQVNSGTWTLTSGASTYSGNFALQGGEVIANGTETAGSSGPLGEGGTLSFVGGTLGFGPNNTFDYSSRFSTTNGLQAYSIDTAGQNVTFATGLAGTGNTMTKVGPGTLFLAGTNTYTGLTYVSAGKLVFAGPKTGTADIAVGDGAALGVTVTNAQYTPGNLNLTNATLEFNGVVSESTPLIAATALNAVGTVNINVNSGTYTVGHSYPLFSWTSGTAPAVNLEFLSGALGTLSTNGNTITLTVTALADNWNGTAGGNWTAANNWLAGGSPITYVDPTPVVFDDSATGGTAVTVDALVQPKSVIVNNSTLSYTITSATGTDIGGSGSLTKNGNNTLTLSGGANTYTGFTTLNAGIVSVSALGDGGSPTDIGAAGNGSSNIVFNGGTLQYTGPATNIDRGFTVATGGGALDASGSGALDLDKSAAIGLSGAGARVFTLTGTSTDTNTLVATLGDQGGASSLTKNGPGWWILAGNNNYSGLTTINNGTLQIGNGGGTGSLGSGNILDIGSLHFNRTNSVTVNSVISGGGSVFLDGTGTVILANNNTYSGGTTISNGTLQVGNGGATGSLNSGAGIVDNGTLIFKTTGTFSYAGGAAISGTGNVIVTSTGLIKAIAGNSYTGWTLIDTNATFQPSEGNQGALVSSVVTNYGTLKLVRQDQNTFFYSNNIVGSGKLVKDVNNNNDNDVTLLGTNTYTGGTIIAGGGIVMGDGVTPQAGQVLGNVLFTNSPTGNDDRRYFEFNRPDSFTFSGNITGTGGGTTGNAGQVAQMGTGTVTLTGNNNYVGGTIVSNGTMQVGNGGSTGSIGSGTVTVENQLVFNRAGTLDVPGQISGNTSGLASIVNAGPGVVILDGANTNFNGPIIITNGTMSVVASGADIDVTGGTLAAGGFNAVGTLQVGGNLNVTNGTIRVEVNKALAQSNSIIVLSNAVTAVLGTANITGSTLSVFNAGATLVPGDRFVIFPGPVSGITSVVSTAYTFQNNLSTDGSITVQTVVQPPAPHITKITNLGGTNLVIAGTNNFGSGGNYSIIATNNLKAPVSTWPVVNTGTFDVNGNLSSTNPISSSNGTNDLFYLIRVP